MNGEKLIKSRERVQKFAEVYTPMRIVKDMCDMMPDAWDDIGKTFWSLLVGTEISLWRFLNAS